MSEQNPDFTAFINPNFAETKIAHLNRKVRHKKDEKRLLRNFSLRDSLFSQSGQSDSQLFLVKRSLDHLSLEKPSANADEDFAVSLAVFGFHISHTYCLVE